MSSDVLSVEPNVLLSQGPALQIYGVGGFVGWMKANLDESGRRKVKLTSVVSENTLYFYSLPQNK